MAEKGELGHRQRLRERFLAGKPESRSDEMLLELLLTFAIDRKDVKPLAQELIRTFGSLSNVLSTTPDKLLQVKGIGHSSATLFQVVNFISSGTISTEARDKLQGEKNSVQQKLFGETTNNLIEKKEQDSQIYAPDESKSPSITSKQQKKDQNALTNNVLIDVPQKIQSSPKSSKKNKLDKMANKRKFQISNGYLLEFDQLARVLHFLLEHREAKKINRKVLQEDSGLAERQIENLVSMGSAMGLIKPSSQVLTPVGLLIAEHDIFIEKQGTLEWCHYVGAGSCRNLIWFEIFNNLLTEPSPLTQSEWLDRLRKQLSGEFTAKTLGTGLREEVRFVLDAYLERNFSKLGLLQHSQGERIYRRRYTNFIPQVLAAMIYDYCASKEDHLSQVSEMVTTPGSPAMVFGLDAPSFRQQIEGLHERGWIRYETTHSLDQIRLKPGFSVLGFLTAHFEDREARPGFESSIKGIIK